MEVKKLVCDICGGKLVMQSGGVAKCDSCGMEYTKERIQEKVQEIKGTVKIEGPVETVKGDAEKERLIKTAQECFRKGAVDEAYKMFRKISTDYPNEWRAWMGIIYSESMYLTDDVIRNNFIHTNQSPENFLKDEYKKAVLFAPEDEHVKINKYRDELVKELHRRISEIQTRDNIIDTINNFKKEITAKKSHIEQVGEIIQNTENDYLNLIEKRRSEVFGGWIWFFIFVVVVAAFIMIPQLSAWWLLLIIPSLGGLSLAFISPAISDENEGKRKRAKEAIERLNKTKNKDELELNEIETKYAELKRKLDKLN